MGIVVWDWADRCLLELLFAGTACRKTIHVIELDLENTHGEMEGGMGHKVNYTLVLVCAAKTDEKSVHVVSDK